MAYKKLLYSMSFQNEFLKVFDKNTKVIKYWNIKDKGFLLLEVYPLTSKSLNIPSVYLPFIFMKYKLIYNYEKSV